jgi:hypothetical protein
MIIDDPISGGAFVNAEGSPIASPAKARQASVIPNLL